MRFDIIIWHFVLAFAWYLLLFQCLLCFHAFLLWSSLNMCRYRYLSWYDLRKHWIFLLDSFQFSLCQDLRVFISVSMLSILCIGYMLAWAVTTDWNIAVDIAVYCFVVVHEQSIFRWSFTHLCTPGSYFIEFVDHFLLNSSILTL